MKVRGHARHFYNLRVCSALASIFIYLGIAGHALGQEPGGATDTAPGTTTTPGTDTTTPPDTTAPGATMPSAPDATLPTAPVDPTVPRPYGAEGGTTNPLGVGSPGLYLGQELRPGWNPYLSLGLTGNTNDTKKVIGRVNGTTTSLGLKVLGHLSLRQDTWDWRNNLSFVYSTYRSPYVPEYVKAEDQLTLSSIYVYHMVNMPWMGPFVRVAVKSTTAAGKDVRDRVRDYVITKRDNTTETRTGDRIRLNDPWRPTIFKETAGASFTLWESRMFNADFLVGIGGRQVYAKDQLVIIDDAHTDQIELLQLNDSKHLGPETILQLRGLLLNDLISYSLVVDALFPTTSSGGTADEDRTAYEGRIIETDGTVSLKLTNWLSVDYTLTSIRDLDLSDEPQLSNTFQFNASYVFSPR
jgi:hypothetical protein